MISGILRIATFFTIRIKLVAVGVAMIVVTMLHSLLAEQLTLTGLIEEATGSELFDPDANDWLWMLEWGVIGLFVLFWAMGRERAMRWTIIGYNAYVTLALAASVVGLVFTLSDRKTADSGFDLLWDGFVVWTINVLIFAVWYWLLEGPRRDTEASAVTRRHFLFPQQANPLPGWENWTPGPLDFLFLAFSHSAAFSPTDTAALSHRAKLLIMTQASLSLITLAMIAARAVNILG